MVLIPIKQASVNASRPQRAPKLKKPKKATNRQVTQQFLDERANFVAALGHPKQKWVMFCEIMLKQGFKLSIYEARLTVSKYITVSNGKKSFKVRFSNHKPISFRQERGDCDFFVGHNHGITTTTNDAIKATIKFFAVAESL